MVEDLRKIKKYYGERMMHLCRSLFPTLLEEPGKLFNLLDTNFSHNKYLYDDIIKENKVDDFRDYIYSINSKNIEMVEVDKTPSELLDEAGYTLYECKSEEDIQRFKDYYAPDEKLCTFKGGRLNSCYVFFAVKNNVLDIKRENFKDPEREDDYGTSVISIQFTKGEFNITSIKNRYNHTVFNPDATFGNNLDNIIPGLTSSFIKEYNFDVVCNDSDFFDLDNYVRANDGKFYRYNYEINNIYYCMDNIIIDNFRVINDYREKEKYLIMDYFIIDLENKTIKLYDDDLKDSFVNAFNNIKKISIIKYKSNGSKVIEIIDKDNNSTVIEIDKYNRMVNYIDNSTMIISDDFLENNFYLERISMDNVVMIGDNCLRLNTKLNEISMDNLEIIGKKFLYNNISLEKIYFPNVKYIDDCFLHYNRSLLEIKLPSLIKIGNYCLPNACSLEKVDIPDINEYELSSNKVKKLGLKNTR